MSQENVEIVRDYFAVTNEGDFAAAMAFYADDVELVVPAYVFLESGTFQGKDAVGQWFGEWFRGFQRGYQFDLEEVRDLDGVVLVAALQSGHGRTSGAEVRAPVAYLFGFRDGKIARLEIFPDRSEALAAADGRSE
jgi:ketosteroid isomerase-like protein